MKKNCRVGIRENISRTRYTAQAISGYFVEWSKQFNLIFEILPYLLLTTLIKSTDSLASNKSHLWDQKVTGLSKITVIILRFWKCKSTNKDCFSLKRIQINKQDSFNGIKNRKNSKFGNSWKHAHARVMIHESTNLHHRKWKMWLNAIIFF